jgi:hypothetical protein
MSPARATTAEKSQPGGLVLLCLAAWAVPGLGHIWLGRRAKGFIFLIALPLMFAVGLALQGRVFSFDPADILTTLEAAAQLGIGVLFFLTGPLGFGKGDVRAITYQYGISFLIVAGLLNVLVVIDAYDVALGRK